MKDAGAGDMLRGGGNQPLIRRCPNGETHCGKPTVHIGLGSYDAGTRGTETSKYPEEDKAIAIP